MRRIVFGLMSVGAVTAATISGCGGDTSGGSPLTAEEQCERVGAKLRSCGLLSEGQTDCAKADESQPCAVNCYVSATCADLKVAICGSAESPSHAFVQCQSRCLDAEGFACGDGGRVPPDCKCDGVPDCDD